MRVSVRNALIRGADEEKTPKRKGHEEGKIWEAGVIYALKNVCRRHVQEKLSAETMN